MGIMLSQQYIPIVFLVVVACGIATVFSVAGVLVGPKLNKGAKLMPFESGMPSTGSEYRRYSVRFYMVALAFLIFDVEIVFFYPWAVRFREFGWPAFCAMGIFFLVLLLGLAYDWRKGALEWE